MKRLQNMKILTGRLPLVILILVSMSFSSEQMIKEKDLARKYREWLDLTSYIILPAEKEVFFQLQTDQDRDIFIESFWKQRDPTPETPQNEYREEHLSRFAYANSKLRRSTPREGWRTDMGRIHIVLGPPASIERFDSQPGVHPCQVWYYRGESIKSLPPLFALVFYQRGGSGEYKLYNPASDGPASLLVRPEAVDQTDYAAVYEKIKELAPALSPVVLSLVPGEFPFNFTPSPQNTILLANILESPRKDVNPRYATDFLHFKGLVSTDYLTNYIESTALVAVIPDPILNLDMIHISISPRKVSVDFYEPKNQYFCNFKLNATLKKGNELVFQHERDFPFYFPPERKENIEANGIAVEDFFPAAEGEYQLSVLLQNSVGREFSFFEKKILIPARDGQKVNLTGPVIGYRLRTHGLDSLMPFKVSDRQLSVDANNTFSMRDELAVIFTVSDAPEKLWRQGRAVITVKGLRSEGASEKKLSIQLAEIPYGRILSYTRSLPLADFTPDYYELEVAVGDEQDNIALSSKANLVVSALENVSHPVTLVWPTNAAMKHFFFYSLAYQYDRLSAPDKAEGLYEKAISLNPEYTRGIAEYALFLVNSGKFDRALEVVEPVASDEKLAFQYYLVKGLALMGKGDYAKAVNFLLEGNKIYNSDVRLLNGLGTCYYKTGRKKDALEVLNVSLRLNPNQKEIKELVDRINVELK